MLLAIKEKIPHVLIVFLFMCVYKAEAATYYVDSRDGNDTNSGRDQSSPWRTLARVDRQVFRAGDRLLLKRGSEWLNASIKVNVEDFYLGAYGEGARPRLIGAVQMILKDWSAAGQGVYRARIRHDWGVQLVAENGERFYKKTDNPGGMSAPGTFFYDKERGHLYIKPFSSKISAEAVFWVGSQNHVIELQDRADVNLQISDLEISYSNRFGVAQWWQGKAVQYGDVSIKNCLFKGNAFSAVALAGKASWRRITILDNEVTMNGGEGIYIGPYAAREKLQILSNKIGGVNDHSFGWRGEGHRSAFNGDGIDVKYGNANVRIVNNQVIGVHGRHGITTQSAGSVISGNQVKEVYLKQGTGQAAISADIQASRGEKKIEETLIHDNYIEAKQSHGIVLRGSTELDPPIRVENNEIILKRGSNFAQIGFLSANNANITIRNNSGQGGRYAVVLAGERPTNMKIERNRFLGVEVVLRIEADVSDGLFLAENQICRNTAKLIDWDVGKSAKVVDRIRKVITSEKFMMVEC